MVSPQLRFAGWTGSGADLKQGFKRKSAVCVAEEEMLGETEETRRGWGRHGSETMCHRAKKFNERSPWPWVTWAISGGSRTWIAAHKHGGPGSTEHQAEVEKPRCGPEKPNLLRTRHSWNLSHQDRQPLGLLEHLSKLSYLENTFPFVGYHRQMTFVWLLIFFCVITWMSKAHFIHLCSHSLNSIS